MFVGLARVSHHQTRSGAKTASVLSKSAKRPAAWLRLGHRGPVGVGNLLLIEHVGGAGPDSGARIIKKVDGWQGLHTQSRELVSFPAETGQVTMLSISEMAVITTSRPGPVSVPTQSQPGTRRLHLLVGNWEWAPPVEEKLDRCPQNPTINPTEIGHIGTLGPRKPPLASGHSWQDGKGLAPRAERKKHAVQSWRPFQIRPSCPYRRAARIPSPHGRSVVREHDTSSARRSVWLQRPTAQPLNRSTAPPLHRSTAQLPGCSAAHLSTARIWPGEQEERTCRSMQSAPPIRPRRGI